MNRVAIQHRPDNTLGPPVPGTLAEQLAREVHAAWLNGMQRQGRPVAVERTSWDTLSPQDKALDRYIGARMVAMVLALKLAEGEIANGG